MDFKDCISKKGTKHPLDMYSDVITIKLKPETTRKLEKIISECNKKTTLLKITKSMFVRACIECGASSDENIEKIVTYLLTIHR